MRKPKRPHRSTHKRELRTVAREKSKKGREPEPKRTVFIYSTTAGGQYD